MCQELSQTLAYNHRNFLKEIPKPVLKKRNIIKTQENVMIKFATGKIKILRRRNTNEFHERKKMSECESFSFLPF